MNAKQITFLVVVGVFLSFSHEMKNSPIHFKYLRGLVRFLLLDTSLANCSLVLGSVLLLKHKYFVRSKFGRVGNTDFGNFNASTITTLFFI